MTVDNRSLQERIYSAEECAQDEIVRAITVLSQGIADTLGPVEGRPVSNRPSKVLLRAIRRAYEPLDEADASLAKVYNEKARIERDKQSKRGA